MIIHIKVKPNAKKDILKKISDTKYKVEIKAPPEKGKANIRLTNFLAKQFKIPASKIKIKNPTSKKKIIEILQ